MMRSHLLPAAVVAFLLPWAGPSARADYFFNWDPDVPTVYGDTAAGRIEFSNPDASGVAVGTRSAVAAALTTALNPGSTGDTFTQGQQGNLKLTIVDGTVEGNVMFPISFDGSLAPDGTGLNVGFPEGTTKEVTVNDQPYTVSIDETTVPGEIVATVTPGETVVVDPPPPPPVDDDPAPTPPVEEDDPPVLSPGAPGSGGALNTPEPSSLVLAGLGAGSALAAAWRRSRGRFVS